MFRFETNLLLHQNWHHNKDFYLDLANDISSGKQIIDNEQWFKKIEQRLKGIDETLRNLTQMVVALTIEGKHEPMERRPNQCSNWQEDGYDNRCRPQIRLEINGGRAIRAGPIVNREPYPL